METNDKKHYDNLLWETLKREFGGSEDAMKFIQDMKHLGIDFGINTKKTLDAGQTLHQLIVAWNYGLVDGVLAMQKLLKEEDE